MGRIRVLSDVVANKIAAGEVVERPASVVKELLENSLDAGASRIRIETEAGGRRLIRIIDNGCGMMRDDALLAFERHATSKLSDVKELLSIATLGFRGEALPSIASVSRLTLETRAEEETTGTLVEIAGGKILRCDEAALAHGTVITVRDLFFNVPARKKFLRSEQTELTHITQLATHYSLAYPDKAFELRHERNELLQVTPVTQLRDRVFQVFGSQIMDELVEITDAHREFKSEDDEDSPEREFHLRGFVSRPQVQKSNRNSIYLFVNGRLIRDRLLMHALSAAYANLIPGSAFPFALLFLDCSPAEVDVNVHPSKTEVRFRRSAFVHDFVRDSIRERLVETRPVSSVPLHATPQRTQGLPFSEFTQQIEDFRYRQFAPAQPEEAPLPNDAPPPGPPLELQPPQRFDPRRFDFGDPAPAPSLNPPVAIARRAIPDTHGPLPPGLVSDPGPSLDILKDLRPMGQLHDSFILAAGADGLWIIDQHVAHERILFEKVLRQMAAGRVERQQLLIPMLIDLTAPQQVEYSRIAAELEAVGFEIEPFGPRTLAVKGAPADVGLAEVERVLFEILEIAEQEQRQASFEDIRRNMAASIACRAAIKINTPLEMNKMLWMLAELAATEFPMSCPHGRPIALRYATRDILKGFHRI
ncbi:MAG: DNA mismatch repair endonuclease MutL [Acidobacteria bacterium]|nr:DNA mismatch repair endonuclease MutL [Acidobacteriota bacterium]